MDESGCYGRKSPIDLCILYPGLYHKYTYQISHLTSVCHSCLSWCINRQTLQITRNQPIRWPAKQIRITPASTLDQQIRKCIQYNTCYESYQGNTYIHSSTYSPKNWYASKNIQSCFSKLSNDGVWCVVKRNMILGVILSLVYWCAWELSHLHTIYVLPVCFLHLLCKILSEHLYAGFSMTTCQYLYDKVFQPRQDI